MSLERILIVRTSALGDIVHAFPVLEAIRDELPDARVGWVVEKPFAQLVEEHPSVDETFVIQTKRWRVRPWDQQHLGEIRALKRALRRFNPQAALDLMGNHKGAAVARLSGAPRRLGVRRRDRREPSSSFWLNETVALDGVHVVDQMLDVARALPLNAETPGYRERDILPNALPIEGPTVLVQPRTAWRNKELPWGTWAAALRSLSRQASSTIGVLVGPDDDGVAGKIVGATPGATEVEAPTLAELASHLRGAQLVLGGDTGPVHLAHALGTEVLCIMGPTDPRRNGPYGKLENALSVELPCSNCYRRYDEPKACLHLIDPEQIADEAAKRLSS